MNQEPKDCDLYIETGICSKLIIFNMPGFIYWTDRTGTIIGGNKTLFQFLDLPSDTFCFKKDYTDIFEPEDAEKYRRIDQQIMENGKSSILEESIPATPGKAARTLLVHKIPLLNNDGEISGLLSITADISDQKAMETNLTNAKKQLETSNQAKLEFLSILNRELRTRINSTIGATQLLSIDKLTNKQQDYVNLINESSHHVLSLINYLVDYVNLEAGKLELYDEEFDLQTLVEKKIIKTFPTAYNKGIEDIILDYPSNIPQFIYADAERISQLFDTFINNAIRFSNSGCIVIRVENIAKTQRDGTILKFSVTDNGVGISPEKQSHLFNMFSEPSQKKPSSDSGFRLSLCKRIVVAMGGSIGVESQPDESTIFWFTVPLSFIPSRKNTSQNNWEAHKNTLRILLADNNPIRGNVILNTLNTKHYQKIHIEEIHQTLLQSYKENTPYDIVIIDPTSITKELDRSIQKMISNDTFKQTLIILLKAPNETLPESILNNSYQINTLDKPITPSTLPSKILELWETFHQYRPHILLVEDTPSNQFIERMMLVQLGCIVDVAITGKEALQKINHANYDLIFMDISLPDDSGLEVSKKIHQIKKTACPPIIAVTSFSSELDNQDFIESGMYDMVTKPVHLETFSNILQTTIPQYKTKPI